MSKLHVDSVIKSFSTKQVLTDVYITCEKGEIVGLFGRNGSGKSTLLRIIFGSLPADGKFVKIGDKTITGLCTNRMLMKYLPQHHFIPDHIKVKTIIGLFCDEANAERMKNHDLIRPLLDRKSKQLSGGEKRLLEVLLIIFSDSAYTFLDEPFNGIAPVYKEEIKNMIREQSKNKGFIITDHDYRNILDISTRLVVLYDGGLKEIKGKDELEYWGYIPETA